MELDVSKLLTKKVDVINFEVEFNGEILKREDFEIKITKPLRITGNAFYDGEIVSVAGDITLTIQAQCSRCLKDFEFPLYVDFEENFSKSKVDEEIYPFTNNCIELTDMVIDNLLISLPLRYLCNEECKGLCPLCGSNLNEGPCGCENDNIDPRLIALKDLFKGK